LVLEPNSVTINDANLVATVYVTGTAIGAIALSDNLPTWITAVLGEYSALSGQAIVVTGTRPDTNVNVSGKFEVSVTRQGLTEVLEVNADLTGDVTITITVSPTSVAVNDANLITSAAIGGNATGVVTLAVTEMPEGYAATSTGASVEVTYKTVPVFTAAVVENRVVITAVKIDDEELGENYKVLGELEITVIRQEAEATLNVSVDLTNAWTPIDKPTYYEITVDGGTFTVNGATGVTSAQEGATVVLTADDRADAGYKFVSWTVITPASLDIALNTFTMPAHTVSVRAEWESISADDFTVHVDEQYSDYINVYPSIIVTSGASVTLTADRIGWEHTGWLVGTTRGALDVSVDNDGMFRMPGSDVYVSATWEQILLEVTFELNGGQLVSGDLVQTVAYGASVTAPVVTSTSDNFIGWAEEGTETLLSQEDVNALTITTNRTFVAQWEVKTFTITFESTADTDVISGKLVHEDVAYGTSVTAPVVEREEYAFIGWFEEGTTIVLEQEQVNAMLVSVTASRTFTAVWEPKDTTQTYTVTFELNGGELVSGQLVHEDVEHGGSVEAPVVRLENHNFAGWALQGTTNIIPETQLNAMLSNVTANRVFVAQWEIVTYTVTFAPNGGTIVDGLAIQTIAHGSPATPPTVTAASVEYMLVGWVDLDTGMSLTEITGDVTFTAQWAGRTTETDFGHTLTVDGNDYDMNVNVSVFNKILNNIFTNTTVTVNVKGAPSNSTLIIQTLVKFSVKVNPYTTIEIPLNVLVRTDADGNGVGEAILDDETVKAFAQTLGMDVEYVLGSTGASAEDGLRGVRHSRNMLGDAYGRNSVTSLSATDIARRIQLDAVSDADLIEIMTENGFCEVAADLNMDGEITLDDVLLLARWLVLGDVAAPRFGVGFSADELAA